MSYPTYFPTGNQQGQNYDPRSGGYAQPVQQTQQPQQGNPGIWNAAPGFACRPVTSREEAVAVQVDFYGPGTIMPDLSHGMIYLKRFNPNTGASDFLDFTFSQPQPKEALPLSYDPRQDIETLRSDLEALRAELEETKKAGSKRTGGKADDK